MAFPTVSSRTDVCFPRTLSHFSASNTNYRESISIEEPESFFPMLDLLTNPDILPRFDKRSPEAQQQLAFETALSAGYLSKPGSLEVVKAQLGLHSATPKIVAFYQHYSEKARPQNVSRETGTCGSWVDWYGEVICAVDKLIGLTGPETLDPSDSSSVFSCASILTLATMTLTPLHREPFPKPQVLAFDHIYPPPGRGLSNPPRTAILYASFQSSNFRELHSHLLRLSSGPAARVQYIFRPIPPEGSTDEKTYLSGYGVTLDLKKMDYLALDDRRSHRSRTLPCYCLLRLSHSKCTRFHHLGRCPNGAR
jgi:UDP-glucose:glycoprotein glucosyltransferase